MLVVGSSQLKSKASGGPEAENTCFIVTGGMGAPLDEYGLQHSAVIMADDGPGIQHLNEYVFPHIPLCNTLSNPFHHGLRPFSLSTEARQFLLRYRTKFLEFIKQ